MSLKVKAREREIKVGKYAGTYRYVMLPEIYSTLAQEKVIREAALRSGVNQGVMQACWDAAGEVIKAWATEGHSVALPGLGTMRFSLSAKSVADVNDVKSSLITTRRIVFTPATELKQELQTTNVVITCYDRDGEIVKRVTTDAGEVEDPEEGSEGSQNTQNNQSNQNTQNNQSNQNTQNEPSDPEPSTGGDNTGGNNGGGSNTGDGWEEG